MKMIQKLTLILAAACSFAGNLMAVNPRQDRPEPKAAAVEKSLKQTMAERIAAQRAKINDIREKNLTARREAANQEYLGAVQAPSCPTMLEDAINPHEMLGVASKASATEVLGLVGDISEAQIKIAYRKLALALHPDKFQDETDKEIAQELFKVVQSAYDELTKPPVEDRQDADDAFGIFARKAYADAQATLSSLHGKMRGLFQKAKSFAQNDQVQRLAFCFLAREFLRATGGVDADLSIVQEFLLQWKLLSSFDN